MIAAFAIGFIAGCTPHPIDAQVRVIDGDTLEIGETVYRIEGIDAPELGQRCRGAESGTWRCGEAARDALAVMAETSQITCREGFEDPYKRIVATCFTDGEDIGAELVRTGLAWAFVRYSKTYVDQEAAARADRIGIWQNLNVPPWEYRQRAWSDAEAKAPEGCPIKGNISQNGHIYHTPWSPWYGRTRIDISKGERWFCSEGEALEAGWRAPYWK